MGNFGKIYFLICGLEEPKLESLVHTGDGGQPDVLEPVLVQNVAQNG